MLKDDWLFTMLKMSEIIQKRGCLIFFTICVALLFTACAADPGVEVVQDSSINVHGTPLELNGKLYVENGFLKNKNGQAIQLRGMSTHGLQWFSQCINENSLKLLATNWGADVIRLSMYVQEDGYSVKPEFFTQLVDKLTDEVTKWNMYVIIDWHQLTPGDPFYNLDLAKQFFEHVSKKHAAKNNLFYEICNEPNGEGSDGVDVNWDRIYNYAMEIIPVIRKNDPDGIVIVGTPWWSSAPDEVIGKPLPFNNIMYTIHFYAASHGQGTRNSTEAAAKAGLALFATEFGTQEYSGDGANDFNSSQKWLDLLAKYKISFANWNFSDHPYSGAVWTDGTCYSNGWSDNNLKEAGHWIKDKLSNPPDAFDK
jgi:endoglucanase